MADAVNNVRQHSNADGKAPVNTRYHSGFVSGLELLLWQYREKIDIREEEWLSTGGIRMDVLVLKKDPAVDLDFNICRIFRVHNILEYKRADDKLNIDVIAKVMAYANLYKSRGVPVNAIPYSDISATIYRHAYPREAFRLLKYHGAVIAEKFTRRLLCKRHGGFFRPDPCGETARPEGIRDVPCTSEGRDR